MNRSLYSDTIQNFLLKSDDELLGILIKSYSFQVDVPQKNAWIEQFKILKRTLSSSNGKIYLEYAIPRMGKFIDALLLIDHVIFILEFKVGESSFNKNSIEQVWDYALDLSNFHDTSQNRIVVPILIATDSKISSLEIISTKQNKSIIQPIYTNGKDLENIINSAISSSSFYDRTRFINNHLFDYTCFPFRITCDHLNSISFFNVQFCWLTCIFFHCMILKLGSPNISSNYKTSGARETIFMNPASRNSRATGPKIRVPLGSSFAFNKTAALSSKRI